MAEQFIYNSDAEESFHSKLDGFHDKYVYHLLLSCVAEKGADLESIKMTKNPATNNKYVARVVGGLLNVKPEVIVKLTEDGRTRLECIITTLNDNKYVYNEVFMIQNVMDWPELGKFSCQIWYLGEVGLQDIKTYWNN